MLPSYQEEGMHQRITKAPKIYFCDTGLAAFLAKVYSSSHLQISAQSLPYLENYSISEIRKSYLNNGQPCSMYYYLDNNQNNISLILKVSETIWSMQIRNRFALNFQPASDFRQLKRSGLAASAHTFLCESDIPKTSSADFLVIPVSLL